MLQNQGLFFLKLTIIIFWSIIFFLFIFSSCNLHNIMQLEPQFIMLSSSMLPVYWLNSLGNLFKAILPSICSLLLTNSIHYFVQLFVFFLIRKLSPWNFCNHNRIMSKVLLICFAHIGDWFYTLPASCLWILYHTTYNLFSL